MYDCESVYTQAKSGDRLVLPVEGEAYVVDLPGCVQEAQRVLREERDWLLEQGKAYAQAAKATVQ